MNSRDYLASDDLDEALERSLQEYQEYEDMDVAGPPHTNGHDVNDAHQPSFVQRQSILANCSRLDAEIASVDEDIARLRALRSSLVEERQTADRALRNLQNTSKPAGTSGPSKTSIDYTTAFEWTGMMKGKLKDVFGIQDYRLCQEGVCNANMDGRDVVCVMPTGGGKSLTYQLPAIMSPGCTLVISPLIALIHDQVMHLTEAGIEAVMLTGSTSKEEAKSIFARLKAGRNPLKDGSRYPEIKLCYVTPEKIAKSKTFVSLLGDMTGAGLLSRIVIDEAHCVSQMGHDYRPDYNKLSILRQCFPNVPILALTATCPPNVLKHLLETLGLRPTCDGEAANKNGTVYFSAPLYRKNLHYKILPKPSSAPAAIKDMVSYILEHHKGCSGIVYCLSKKDTETVAVGLEELSAGEIKTGVYHSEVGDSAKEALHRRWRQGKVDVVCATIAFGMGIDKGDVRFVIHHSMPKSLEGYYQETGRAGRDGKDADCILYFRAQDASRMSSLVCGTGDTSSLDKLHGMLRFALDKSECRKVAFANYFSASTSLSLAAWSDTGSTELSLCGHCDNCLRPAGSSEDKDVTLQAFQLCRIAEEVDRAGGRVTVASLADLARGNGGATFGVVKGKGKRTKMDEKATMDLHAVAGGAVDLGKDDVETLIVKLILSKHLQEAFHPTAYSINVYVVPGPQAVRLTRLKRDQVNSGSGERIRMIFTSKAKAAKKPAKRKNQVDDVPSTASGSSQLRRNRSLAEIVAEKKGKGKENQDMPELYGDQDDPFSEDEGTQEERVFLEPDSDEDDPFWAPSPPPPLRTTRNEDDIWSFSMREHKEELDNDEDAAPMPKRRRKDGMVYTRHSEVVVLSD